MTQLPLQWLDEARLGAMPNHPPRSRYDKPAGHTLARSSDPETSVQAAGLALDFAGKHAAKIFAWLADHPAGGTKDEIAAGTGIDAIAVARRIKALRDTAGVYDSGETRKTPTGRAATVWKVRT